MQEIIFLFAIFLTSSIYQNYSDYSNEAGYCNNHNTYIRCYITNIDTQSIKTLLSTGSQGSTSEYQLYVYKSYSSDSSYLTLEFNISSNIRYLKLDPLSKYETFNDTPEINNPEQITPSMYANMVNQTELHSNMTIPELHPGEAAGYLYLKGILSKLCGLP